MVHRLLLLICRAPLPELKRNQMNFNIIKIVESDFFTDCQREITKISERVFEFMNSRRNEHDEIAGLYQIEQILAVNILT